MMAGMTQAVSTAIADAWRAQRLWSNTANKLKRRIGFWRSTALAMAILGAILATAATQVGLKTGLGQGLSVASAVALAAVPFIRQTWLKKGDIAAWTRARSASEGLKAETYLYLTSTAPYDGTDRDTQLARQTDAITGDVDDLRRHTKDVVANDKKLPEVTDLATYLSVRVQPQIDGYYDRAANEQDERLSLFRTIETGLSAVAFVLSIVAAATHVGGFGIWVGVVTTVGAAITAHIAAARYEHLVISYRATARQLRALVRDWNASPDHDAAAAGRMVRSCEDVISRENESWMAAWSKDDDSAAKAGG
jgi:hypothetical protein